MSRKKLIYKEFLLYIFKMGALQIKIFKNTIISLLQVTLLLIKYIMHSAINISSLVYINK